MINRYRKLPSFASFAFAVVLATAGTASAAPITVTGNANGSLATAEGFTIFNPDNFLALFLTNTSPFDARITGVGFDLVPGDFIANGSSGLNGFFGNEPGSSTFTDGALGNVPQFNNAVLDFGWLTGNNFAGGNPPSGLAPGDSVLLVVVGPFTGLTDEGIASGLFVRFQRVGEDGELSDVGRTTNSSPVPEPASLTLLGGGLLSLAAAARRRKPTAK